MIEDLERELVRAMAKEVADLPEPHLDLHRMQHYRPARRLVVPGVAVGVAMVVATPLAAAHSGVFRSAPAADKHVQLSTPAGPLTPPDPRLSVSVPPSVPSVPGAPGVPAAQPLPSLEPTLTVPDTCTAVRRALTAAEHAAAARQLRAAFDGVARRLLGDGVSRHVAALSAADVDRLLPPAGAMITYYDCSLGQTLTPEQRAAAVAEVRRAVTDAQTALLAARSAIEQALGNGKLPSWLGDLDIHVVSRTAAAMVVRVDLGAARPGLPASGSVTVTVRLADRAVVSIQPSGLKLPPGLPVPKIPVSLPSLPIPVPLPPQVPGLPTSGR
jgi:hypothetical protein